MNATVRSAECNISYRVLLLLLVEVELQSMVVVHFMSHVKLGHSM